MFVHQLVFTSVWLLGFLFVNHMAQSMVTVRFYLMKKSMWTPKLIEEAQYDLGLYATEYCSANKALCSGNTKLNSSDAVISNIIDSGNYLNVSMSMPLISDSALITIISNYRSKLATTIGYHIVKVGDKIFSPPPPTRLNTIIIPISLIIVLCLIVATYVVHRISYRKELDLIMKDNQHGASVIYSTKFSSHYDDTNGTNGDASFLKERNENRSAKSLSERQQPLNSRSPEEGEQGDVEVRARSSTSSKDSVTAHIEAELAASQQITSF